MKRKSRDWGMRRPVMKHIRLYGLIALLTSVSTGAVAQRGRSPRQAPVRITSGTPTTPASPLTITIAPNATVWIDDIRRGVTDASGKLVLTRISPGRHTLRVRANGFKEVTMP